MYHGTEKRRGEKIVLSQKMIPSISTERRQHWLGDGIYLYREIFYAFRWIVIMYNDYFGDGDECHDLNETYSILNVEIDYNSERIFNLDNPEHYLVFKETEEAYKKKSAFSDKLSNVEYADGIIINILFKNLSYGENYDAVEASFPIIEVDDCYAEKSRLKNINEYQLCVKNDTMIKNIHDITPDINFQELSLKYEKFVKFRKTKSKKRRNPSKYSNYQRGKNYGKRKRITG